MLGSLMLASLISHFEHYTLISITSVGIEST